ncbi:MAG: ankyrin repeat domain-containing protein [Rhodocyclaceae bacterium]|nr:ankyrin repeat domain-containing protein [Rhodocyclaceae bacterium]
MLRSFRAGTLAELVVLDSRDAAHYAAGHIAEAEPLDHGGFPRLIRRLPKAAPLLIYCYHGNASQAWAEAFADFGFARPLSVDGGFEAFEAALEGHLPTVRPSAAGASDGLHAFLNEYGFDPDDLDNPRAHGLTPLMRAALSAQAGLVAELVQLGADLHIRNDDGNTALWLACVGGSEDAARILVEAGIDLDNRNLVGATCLMYCASAGKPAMLARLLAWGADPLLTNQDDARAVDLAATRECLHLLRPTARRLSEEMPS